MCCPSVQKIHHQNICHVTLCQHWQALRFRKDALLQQMPSVSSSIIGLTIWLLTITMMSFVAGFVGVPVMLPDRSVVDSADLPNGATRRSPIAITHQRLVQALHLGAQHSTSGGTSSGSRSTRQSQRQARQALAQDSTFQSTQRLEQEILAADPLEIESTALMNLHRNVNDTGAQALQYRPVSLSDGRMLQSAGGLPGDSLSLCLSRLETAWSQIMCKATARQSWCIEDLIYGLVFEWHCIYKRSLWKWIGLDGTRSQDYIQNEYCERDFMSMVYWTLQNGVQISLLCFFHY